MNRDQLLNLTLTDLSFKELLALFKRRKWVIMGTMLVLIVLAVIYSKVVPPTYKAATIVVVEGRTQTNSGQSTDVVGAITQSGLDYDVMTQIQIMQSFYILYNSLKRINYKMPDRITQDEYEKLPKVTVTQLQTTNTVQIAVESTSDQVAAQLGAALPQYYGEYVNSIQKDDVKRSYDFVSARIKEERESVQNQQQELAQFKADNGITDSKTELEVRAGALAESQRRLAEADGDVNSSKAGYDEATKAFQSAPKTVKNPTVVTQNEFIQRSEEQLTILKQQRSALLVNNLPDSDRVQRLDAQIKEQQNLVDNLKANPQTSAASEIRNPALDDMERTMNMAKASYEGSMARRDAIKNLVEQRKQDVKALAPLTGQQQQKETKLQESQGIITKLLDIQNSIRLRDNSLPSPIRDVTGTPVAILVRPILSVNVALAALLGLVLGVVFALARDLMLDKVNTSNEACLISGKEIIGRIPLRASGRSALIADPQKARAFEGYRILRSSMLLANPTSKSFLVTSTVSKEGKTTVAGNLAVALALDGKRTVLVDASLRSPAVHKLFKVDQAKGVTEVVSGSASLEEALKPTDTPGLMVMTSGLESANPTELVASPAMKDLISKLESQADIVIIDSASAFGHADTQSLLAHVKNVLYVTEFESPTKTQMRDAVAMVQFAGGDITGIIVNKDRLAATRTRGNT